MSSAIDSPLLDVTGLAEYLRLPPSWVNARKKQIPHIKLGRYVRFDISSVDFQKWLDSLRSNQYDAEQSKKDGPVELEDQTMARTSYQEGSIKRVKRKQGLVYVLRYRLRSGDGWIEKTEELPGCKDKKEAREAADKRMVKINELNSRQQRRAVTVAEFIGGLWQKYAERFKPSTSYSYGSMLNTYVLPSWGHRMVDSIQPEDVTWFFTAREQERLSSKYRLNLYLLLNSVFALAEEYNLLESNPVRRKLHRPVVEREEKPTLTVQEVGRVINEVAEENKALMICVAVELLRLGELLALRW
jgi:hypothetical protein